MPAFHFASGDLILGDFNYEEIKDNLFNPCEEITEEEFAMVGLEKVGPSTPLLVGGVGCGLLDTSGEKSVAIGTSSATKEFIFSRPDLEARSDVSEVVPGLMLYRGTQAGIISCVAAVDTVRGEFSIIAGDLKASTEFDETCSYAQKVMEKFYLQR
ncbi:hypothetical protein HMPREF2129_10640 [Corynebacterium tuscaniense DNF00037]|nr:hypothetical protein HMPREF2129_10640 [Corynebacterium tuscaniense DNF00037]